MRVYSPGTYLDFHGASRAIDSLWSHRFSSHILQVMISQAGSGSQHLLACWQWLSALMGRPSIMNPLLRELNNKHPKIINLSVAGGIKQQKSPNAVPPSGGVKGSSSSHITGSKASKTHSFSNFQKCSKMHQDDPLVTPK